jgi:hypothetical protein
MNSLRAGTVLRALVSTKTQGFRHGCTEVSRQASLGQFCSGRHKAA